MAGLVTLTLPFGQVTWTYPISHGTESFVPYRADHRDPASEWRVDVPAHVAAHLIHNGGFALVPTIHVLHSAGSIPMVHPDRPYSCSWGGMTIHADPDGVFTVPAEAVGDLQSHGFVPYEAPRVEPQPVVEAPTGPFLRYDAPAEPPAVAEAAPAAEPATKTKAPAAAKA